MAAGISAVRGIGHVNGLLAIFHPPIAAMRHG
jgi:hypothetical protein